jgi:hypothetical protein
MPRSRTALPGKLSCASLVTPRNFPSFAFEFGGKNIYTGRVATGLSDGANQPLSKHIICDADDGIDCVTCCAARIASSPPQTNASILEAARASANSENCSDRAAKPRESTTRFCPSRNPRFCNSPKRQRNWPRSFLWTRVRRISI